MTPNDRFKGHFDFLDHLDETIEAALVQYRDAEEADLEELRHLQREVGLARRTLAALCKKYTQPIADQQAEEAAAVSHDPVASEKSAASL